jgi:ATP/ADP translocase
MMLYLFCSGRAQQRVNNKRPTPNKKTNVDIFFLCMMAIGCIAILIIIVMVIYNNNSGENQGDINLLNNENNGYKNQKTRRMSFNSKNKSRSESSYESKPFPSNKESVSEKTSIERKKKQKI